MSGLLPLATGLVCWWMSVYRRGLPEGERAARRAEIGSDLWDHARFGAAAAVLRACTIESGRLKGA
jgi:hypothetical protein